MASIIPGYEYDIFISYRQKDNKGDRWVSEFVDALKNELESTFKEDISIYFDENPHDRLQETHNVDKSLEGKLKCFIFIPILSQTYCDPNSYAWQYEFQVFNKLSKEDPFGKDIKLRNGNYASRILPIRIHGLEQEDVKLFEKETGSLLRAMDFIFKTASGVNRPLKSNEDHPNDNLNKIFYTDQINKTANAIKEIVSGLKTEATSLVKGESISKESKSEVKFEDKRKDRIGNAIFNQKSKKRLIILVSVFLFITSAYTIFKIIDRSKQTQDLTNLEKSIAVLPFRNDTSNDSTTYFLNGVMEEILNNLQKISDFSRVLSRNSVEQFRNNTTKSTPEIAKALGVNYIVEGSGQKYGNTFRLRVQLIAANNEKHLWGESYEQEIHETKDIFKIQSQVAQTIASELKATITPEEKKLIERTATANLNAYDFYQRGNEALKEYYFGGNNSFLNKAEGFFSKALIYDSTFARAYAGLAGVYYWRHGNEYKSYFTKNYLDSVLILADRALSFDDHLSEGYFYRASYYINNGETEQAAKEFDKAIKYNPNYWEAYLQKGNDVYLGDLKNSDYVKGLEYMHKAARINRGRELPYIFYNLGNAYTYFAGFPEEAKKYYQEAFKLDGDTTSYNSYLGSQEIQYGDFEKGIEKSLKAYAKDSFSLRLANQYYYNGQYKESLKYVVKIIEKSKSLGQIPPGNLSMIGYVYWQNGFIKEAEHWFNEQKRLSQESMKLGRGYSTSSWFSSNAYYDLAGVYAFAGEKKKAYEILRMITRYPILPLSMANDIKKYNPLFSSIRNESEFQQIVRDVEAKYQAEHERVRKWLEEQGKL
jgi:TolB-like protein/Tfp pilus assembly protein PilF